VNKLTLITPTTGKSSLYKLINSIDAQDIPVDHILLWDSKREDDFLYPNFATLITKKPADLDEVRDNGSCRYSIVIPSSFVRGVAYGSSLRAVGLMAANTEFVMFCDDDVFFDNNHFKSMLKLVENHNWAYCRRKVWANVNDYIGVDNFESVGDSSDRKVPYEMVDNNCMIFNRRLGSSAAVIYRETTEYNDDRNFYAFLKQYGGIPSVTKEATINQICPQRLEGMFRQGCSK
jgi:hypothetical protein